MYYGVYDNVIEEDNSIRSMPYLLEYNLKDGTYRLITRESMDAIMTIQATENYVFLRMISNASESRGDIYLKRVNINTLEEEIIISTGETIDISEKGFKYNLRSYNGFSKVFMSESLHDTMLISEDEILGHEEKSGT